MNHLAAIQSQLAINKQVIQMIEHSIYQLRQRKTQADNMGWLEEEYACHEELKFLRNNLKNYVRIQKALKQLVKG